MDQTPTNTPAVDRQLTDMEKAERAAEIFSRFVGPLLDKYLKLKRTRAPEEQVTQARRLYERAHGKFNEDQADDELREATEHLTSTTPATRQGDERTNG